MHDDFTKPVLMELQYFPPIQYLTKFLLYPQVVIEQHEHYQKGGFRNRCLIVNANSTQILTVPLVKGKNEQQSIREVKIAYIDNWQRIHWTSIQSAYGNAPFFEHYADHFKGFFNRKYETLFDLNRVVLYKILQILQIESNIDTTSEFEKIPTVFNDFRNKISTRKSNTFVDKNFTPIHYSQVFEEKHGFLPNLSILDLIFCKGPEALGYLEQCISK